MNIDATTYRQRQILLVVAGIVVFSEPFLGIVRSEAIVFGLPVTMVALFGLWLAVIVGIAWIMRSDPGPMYTSGTASPSDSAPKTTPTSRPVSRERPR